MKPFSDNFFVFWTGFLCILGAKNGETETGFLSFVIFGRTGRQDDWSGTVRAVKMTDPGPPGAPVWVAGAPILAKVGALGLPKSS